MPRETPFKLYELPEIYDGVAAMLEENGGELTPEMEEALSTADDALESKLQNVAALIRQFDAQDAAVTCEIDRLTKLRETRRKAVQGLKEYVVRQLEEMDKTRVVTPLCVVRVQQNSQPSVEWLGEEIPNEYRAEPKPQPVTFDYAKVVRAYRAGAELPQGFVVEFGRHLRIQ